MINVLHTIDSNYPGGAETIFIELFRRLDKDQFNSYVALEKGSWAEKQLMKLKFNPMRMESQGAFNIKYLLNIISIIKKYNIHIVQSHLLGSNVYCSIAGLICNVPVISTFHGYIDIDKKDKLLKYKFAIINRGSTRVIFVSDHLKNYYFQNTNINKNKSKTIYNGIDSSNYMKKKTNIIKKEIGFSDDHVLIGLIGNIGKVKGYDVLIKAAALVMSKRPECRFVIVGDQSGSEFNNLMKLRSKLKLDDIVVFLGFRDDINNILNNLDLFVLSSISEGLSIVTLEAMACEVPVVVTKCGGPEEIVEQGVNGVLVNTGDYHSLADGILCMLENEQLRKSCISGARELITRKFSLNTMVMQYEECYRECAEKDR